MKTSGAWVYQMDLPELGKVKATFKIGDDGEISFGHVNYEGEDLTLEQVRRVEGDGVNDALKAAWEAWHEGPVDAWRKDQKKRQVEEAWRLHRGG